MDLQKVLILAGFNDLYFSLSMHLYHLSGVNITNKTNFKIQQLKTKEFEFVASTQFLSDQLMFIIATILRQKW